MSILRIANAHKYYNPGRMNELHVMNNINLELPESGLVAIFGPSGCGKTTLLNAVGGLDSIASGQIELFGQDIRKNTDNLRNRYVGYIFQNYNLNINETVYENVAAALRLCGLDDDTEIADRVAAALANVGMDKYASRTPDTLSGGQQQRVAIARALVKNPAIILADEPTGNLDEANTVLVMDILKEISRTHLVLLVTHEANLVDYYCDRVIEIVDGRIMTDRQNTGANGYVRRNKNDIYLGELETSEIQGPGVHVTYYGEPAAPLRLSVVHVGGKLYLKADDPTVKLLDDSSEIRLVEGVFDAAPVTTEGANHNGHAIDMSRLTPVTPAPGTKIGRLYHWKNALGAAWRENFSKKKKKSNRRLRFCLFFLAVVMVFMTAGYGAGIRGYEQNRENHNEALFYIPLDPTKDYTEINAELGRHGMDFARFIGSYPLYSTDDLSFSLSVFMTANTPALHASAHAVNVDALGDLPVVAGVGKIQSGSEILITTAVADDLIETSTVGYIDTYEDLVGLTASEQYGSATPLRVAGVVESDEFFYYMEPVAYAAAIMEKQLYSYLPVVPVSQTPIKTVPETGEVIYLHFTDMGISSPGIPEDSVIYTDGIAEFEAAEVIPNEVKPEIGTSTAEAPYKVGDTVVILGKTFTVSEVVPLTMEDIYDNPDFTASEKFDTYKTFALSDADYVSLTYALGKIDLGVEYGQYIPYERYDYTWGTQYTNHLMIRSSDPAATAAFLDEALGRSGYLSPDDILAEGLADVRSAAAAAAVSVLVVLALMCLCVFFIMRSSFMSRVREVGILRAIGVTGGNLIFRFAVETGVLVLLTTVLGYLASAWFIGSLSGTVLFTSIFYFPVWLAVGLLILIYAMSLFFGVLPAMLLLRKTPSEILSKYDI